MAVHWNSRSLSANARGAEAPVPQSVLGGLVLGVAFDLTDPALEQVLRTTDRVKLVYTVPDHQNPTGRTMSLARRRRLVELAQEFDVVILEDTPYRELRYEGERLPTIKSLDTTGRVVHLGSFSKILAPGLRLGWALATPEIREKLALLRLAADTQNGTLNMRAAAAYLGGYDIEGHIAGMLPTYRHQRDLMLASLQEHFPPGITKGTSIKHLL